jgi:hypothetical protein
MTAMQAEMYRFASGKLEGMTLEHAMLRKAPKLYEMIKWARGKTHLGRLVAEFDRLRAKLRNAPVVRKCRHEGCSRAATHMTLPMGVDRCYLPCPHFWCKKHEPYDYDGISPKLRISLTEMGNFEKRNNRSAIHHAVLFALGIDKEPSRITESFARKFFISLDSG